MNDAELLIMDHKINFSNHFRDQSEDIVTSQKVRGFRTFPLLQRGIEGDFLNTDRIY